MNDSQQMKDKRVLVTGSGTGIGREVALEFARRGAAVVFHYSHSDQGATSGVQEARRTGGKAEAFKADFNCMEETRILATRTLDFLGGIDVLVNNAGITMNLPFERVTLAQYDTLYNINIRAQFFLTQAMLPAMPRAGGGVVINMTSIHALEGLTEHSVYAGTKGAIVAYTRALAIELAPRGVRVNALAVGAVPVANYPADIDPVALGRLIPVGFAGTPLDIAKITVFLASDDARFIVGQTLIADGGTTSWMPFGEGFRQPIQGQFGKGYVPGL